MGSKSLGLRAVRGLTARIASLPRWWSQVAFPCATEPIASRRDSRVGTLAALLLLIVAGGLLSFGRLRVPLLQPEDAYYAEIAREMAAADSWVVPLYHGQPYYQKPPLLYWLIRVGYAAFGVHDWAARLVLCTAALATVLVAFAWGRRIFGLRAGLAGALILCLSPRFLHQARMITMDGLLALWIVGALALGQQAVQSGRLRWGCWLLSAASCGLGLLTKGPVSLVLVAIPLLAYQVLDPRTARPRGWCWPAYLAVVLGLALPWYAAMTWRDPAFLREHIWTHHVVMRFLQPLHPEPAWFYVPVLVLGMLPWTVLFPALLRLLLRRSAPAARKRPAALGFLLLTCSWCILFFSVADCKRIGYVLPAMPTLALALGYTLDRIVPRRELGPSALRLRTACLPYWTGLAVWVVGIGSGALVTFVGLLTPVQGVAIVAGSLAGLAWSVSRFRRETASASWTRCALAAFSLMLVTVHLLLPGYYRKFSLRHQVWLARDGLPQTEVPVVCYPHLWDSIRFYLERQDVRSYGGDERDRLLTDLQGRPETLLFVKSGPALDDLLPRLPASLEFVPSSRGEIVTVGLVRRRSR
jgi:dolichol-phosphate mannosyltransferase